MLSIVVVFFNMQREATRTLHSLSSDYQRGVDAGQYEVIAIDNGSPRPLDACFVKSQGPNFRYHFHATDSISPAEAVNLGVEMARGEFVAVIVDGARMASPGLVKHTLQALAMSPDPVVGALAWHLGPDVQNHSMLEGYDQRVEDQLLESIDWPADGYRLFEIAVLAQSSARGFLGGMPGELSWLCLRRDTFQRIGGFRPAFRSRGGGLVNQDIRNRLMTCEGIAPLMLLGEGVFHQFHGGVATNVPMEQHPILEFKAEYEAIVGKPFSRSSTPQVEYLGPMPEAARRFINRVPRS